MCVGQHLLPVPREHIKRIKACVGSNLRSRPEILESKRMIQMLLDPDGSTRTDSSKKGCRCPKQDAPKRTTRAPMAFPP